MNRLLPVGRVSKPHGLRGWLKVHVYDPDSDSLYRADEVWIDGPQPTRHRVEEISRAGKHTLLGLAGIDTVTQADSFRGREVLVDRRWLPDLDEDEFYYDDLVGLAVFDEAGNRLGEIVEVFPAGEQDVYVCKGSDQEIQIPADTDHVRSIDLAAGRLVMGPIDPAFVTPTSPKKQQKDAD